MSLSGCDAGDRADRRTRAKRVILRLSPNLHYVRFQLRCWLRDAEEPLLRMRCRLPRPATRPIAIRFDEHTLERIKILARKRHKGYQTLLKEFVTERPSAKEKHGHSGQFQYLIR